MIRHLAGFSERTLPEFSSIHIEGVLIALQYRVGYPVIAGNVGLNPGLAGRRNRASGTVDEVREVGLRFGEQGQPGSSAGS